MTLQQLRAFLAIVDSGSFRRAARVLDISQAGLTGSIQALEVGLGVVLFQRSAQGVRLTEDGERLLPRARLISSESHRVVIDALHAQGQREGMLHVGLGPTPTALLLSRVIPDFHARFPLARLKLVEGFFDELRPSLQQGKIEFAITAVPDEGVGPGLKSEVLFQSHLTVIGRVGHPCAQVTSLRDLAHLEWVLTGAPGEPGGTVARFHVEQGLPPPRVAAICESFTQLAALIAGTDWLAIVPSALTEQGFLGPQVKPLALQEQAPRFDNCLVHRIDSPLTPAASALAAMLASCARALKGRSAG